MDTTSGKQGGPLQAAKRVTRNFMLARAWNPARWPWLVAQFVRNFSTLGLAGTLARLQHTGDPSVPVPCAVSGIEPVGDPTAPAAFAVHDEPRVSIVIPVRDNWVCTAACLRSLSTARCGQSFEVIVVDDRSRDETPERLAEIAGLTCLANPRSKGLASCGNRGSRHAKGEFLVLLDGATQVTDDWLDELVNTLESEPKAGAVGSRLVSPGGRLLEAGGVVFKDGQGLPYGRDDNADNPEYHFMREADYCSGVCMAIRTSLFHEVGGLDERYAVTPYEDADLAFRVRQAGYKVLVQPLSVVVHHEDAEDHGDSGAAYFRDAARQAFARTWEEPLNAQPEHPDTGEDRATLRAASSHRARGRILFIDATTPEPDRDSGSLRLSKLMHCCVELGYAVTFFADNRAYTGEHTRALQRAGIEVLYHPWLDSLHDFFRDRGDEFDCVFISRHYVAVNYIPLLHRYCPEARFVFDTVDLHYLREQRLAELEGSLPLKRAARQTRRSELSVVEAADVTVVVSEAEAEVLAGDAPGARVHVLSNIHDVSGRRKLFSERKDIWFIGAYKHPPNVDAACWFAREIWPLVHDALPDVRFHLVGSNAPDRVRALQGNGVVFHGFVKDLDPFLDGCRIAVAPLRYGAGVKGKVNMSMAHGQPVVGTPVAVEGIHTEHGREVLVAQDKSSFAHDVIRLYGDELLWRRLSDASIENVEENFSVSAARRSLNSLLDTLLH